MGVRFSSLAPKETKPRISRFFIFIDSSKKIGLHLVCDWFILKEANFGPRKGKCRMIDFMRSLLFGVTEGTPHF
jgi:hypothetical protein